MVSSEVECLSPPTNPHLTIQLPSFPTENFSLIDEELKELYLK